MQYFYCSDSSASANCPAARLTPRAVIFAASRAEAREVFAEIEAARGPYRFGKAALRKQTARERRRIVSPADGLPDAEEYLRHLRGEFERF